MNHAHDGLAVAAGQAAARELDNALGRIRHCVGQLDDDQLWWRPDERLNSIANLMLHLQGNLRQWIVVGLGGGVDNRKRAREFTDRGPYPKDQLLDALSETVQAAREVVSRQTSELDWLRPRSIQGFDVSGLEALFDSVSHFRGHTQEIIHLTRRQLGEEYQFAFVPDTRQQGAE